MGCLLQRIQGNFHLYQLGSVTSVNHGKFHQEQTTLKAFVSHTGLPQTVEKFDGLERYWANATSNL